MDDRFTWHEGDIEIVHTGAASESATLDERARDFSTELAGFSDFDRHGFSVEELRADSNWPWAKVHGVYCFVRSGQVVYVGRALGNTIGQRLWDQLRSVSDPEWAEVVGDPETRVEVFAVDAEHAYIGAALEAYLISHLQPYFNSKIT